MSDTPQTLPVPDANPVFQSILDAGRAWYRSAKPGDALPLSCTVGLLNRSEPAGAEQSAEERVRAWAVAKGFAVTLYQPPMPDPVYVSTGRNKAIVPPQILTVTITR